MTSEVATADAPLTIEIFPALRQYFPDTDVLPVQAEDVRISNYPQLETKAGVRKISKADDAVFSQSELNWMIREEQVRAFCNLSRWRNEIDVITTNCVLCTVTVVALTSNGHVVAVYIDCEKKRK